MKKEILVNVGVLESRVAILEDGRLAELHLEREPRVVGNVYKARVATVLPGMEAAFVDLGLEKHGFLSADDLGYRCRDDDEGEESAPQEGRRRSASISELRSGQEIMVQVDRAAIGTKGARVSTRIAIPGRYMVLLLTDPGRVGVSRKIESEKVRQKLKQVGEEICPEGFGLIMRTESEGARKTQLVQDLQMLLELRRRMLDAAASKSAPALLYEDLSLVFQVIRDSFTKDVERLLIDHEGTYRSALEVVGMLSPRLKSRVSLYSEAKGIFERFGVEEEISRLWQRKVWLKAGGYISIDQTEALCAIDVNTARYTGRARTGLSETILRTNLEAAEEIARQLRLRDLGGIIVFDFIDMDTAAHRTKVLKALESALERDRAKTRALSISALGLVQMTRKKHGESLLEKTSDLCPACGGLGRVQNPVSVSIHIHRELKEKAQSGGPGVLAVWAHPRVACMLVGGGGELVKQLAATLQRPIYVRAKGEDATEFDVAVVPPDQIDERIPTFHIGQELKCRRISPLDSGIQTDLAVSEEGYLVELKLPSKVALDGEFTVELLDVDTSWGVGRVTSVAAAPSAEGKPPKGSGISRRGMRRREKREARRREAAAAAAQAPPPPDDTFAPAATMAPPPPLVSPLTEGDEQSAEHRKKRRRRRRKPGATSSADTAAEAPTLEEVDAELTIAEEAAAEGAGEGTAAPAKKRRRRRRRKAPLATPEGAEVEEEAGDEPTIAEEAAAEEPIEVASEEHKKRRRRRRRRKPAVPAEGESAPTPTDAAGVEPAPVETEVAHPDAPAESPEAETPAKRRRSRRSARKPAGTTEPSVEATAPTATLEAAPATPTPEASTKQSTPKRRRSPISEKKPAEDAAPGDAADGGAVAEEASPKRRRVTARRPKAESGDSQPAPRE